MNGCMGLINIDVKHNFRNLYILIQSAMDMKLTFYITKRNFQMLSWQANNPDIFSEMLDSLNTWNEINAPYYLNLHDILMNTLFIFTIVGII